MGKEGKLFTNQTHRELISVETEKPCVEVGIKPYKGKSRSELFHAIPDAVRVISRRTRLATGAARLCGAATAVTLVVGIADLAEKRIGMGVGTLCFSGAAAAGTFISERRRRRYKAQEDVVLNAQADAVREAKKHS